MVHTTDVCDFIHLLLIFVLSLSSQITVPDLSSLPLCIRSWVSGQSPAYVLSSPHHPPLSPPLYPLKGRDPMTGEDLTQRKALPCTYDAVYDVLGSALEVSRGVLVVELVANAGSRGEAVLAR